jgi:hypothetical protein
MVWSMFMVPKWPVLSWWFVTSIRNLLGSAGGRGTIHVASQPGHFSLAGRWLVNVAS